jgi:hypothetical protein
MVLTGRAKGTWCYVTALGIAFSFLGQPTAAEPPHNGARASPASAPPQQAPQDHGPPRWAVSLEGSAQRIANALEAKNAYDRSPQGQQDAHDASRGAKEAAKWAGRMFWAALAETIITFVGIALVGFTLREAKRSADAAKDQLELAQKDFVALHRPKIHIRFVETIGWDSSKNVMPITITYVNVGLTEANIHRFVCDVGFRNSSGKWITEPMITDIRGKAKNITVAANGKMGTTRYTAAIDPSVWDEIKVGTTKFYVAGYSRYDDRYDIERKTGFIWMWEPSREEFLPVNEARFSYED